ncbi:glycosyltransferase [Arthrobacter glacialis]|uniref:D-inositol 3-phosphate glycosyltransferase n=1 Tax=Arthrobacter glacialis TaxID=1664 RepID=A0A2S3ZZ83_ARTGL|nr:glycosyltransferase [Arthrobacter glacialis]
MGRRYLPCHWQGVTKNVRVLVFTTWFPDSENQATAPFNLKHVQAIAAQHDVRVIHVRLGGSGDVISENYGAVPVTRIPLSPRRPLGYLAMARQLWAALWQTDVLHTMAFSSAVIAAPVQAFKRTRWVHTEHWSGMANPASVSKLWVVFSPLRYVLKLPDAVTAVSAAQADQLSRFARGGRVEVVPNVVQGPDALATRQGMPDGAPRLVGVGGLIARKRPMLALEALRLVRAGGLDATLTLVGDGPLRAELESAAAAANLGGKFTITGLVAPDQVSAALRAADLFILPSSHETFCVSAAEAVAAGLPAIVTDLPAVRDFLTVRNSVLVAGDSAEDFAAGIHDALAKFSQVSPATISGTIASRYAPRVIADKFSAVYARVRGAGG